MVTNSRVVWGHPTSNMGLWEREKELNRAENGTEGRAWCVVCVQELCVCREQLCCGLQEAHRHGPEGAHGDGTVLLCVVIQLCTDT